MANPTYLKCVLIGHRLHTHRHRRACTRPPATATHLQVVLRVPIAVVDDGRVCGGQRDALAPRTCGQQEGKAVLRSSCRVPQPSAVPLFLSTQPLARNAKLSSGPAAEHHSHQQHHCVLPRSPCVKSDSGWKRSYLLRGCCLPLLEAQLPTSWLLLATTGKQ